MIPMRNLFTPRTMDVLRITLYEQPALSPLVGISFIVLLKSCFLFSSLQSVSQKSCDDCLFLNKCSTEKLCLLADVMLVSIILIILKLILEIFCIFVVFSCFINHSFQINSLLKMILIVFNFYLGKIVLKWILKLVLTYIFSNRDEGCFFIG
jgi:hypothetical protein